MIEDVGGGVVITGKDDIAFFRLLTLRSGLHLETLGMHHSRGSIYALVKREFGFKGTKTKVLAQLDAHIAKVKEQRRAP